jgi:signal transduction histidine kinase
VDRASEARVKSDWWPRRPPPLDIATALVFVALALAEIGASDTSEAAFRHALLSALPLALLAWRRQYPELVAILVVMSNVIGNPDFQFTIVLSLVLVTYTVGAETDQPRSYVGLAATLSLFLVGLVAANGFLPSDFAAAAVFVVGPWLVGSVTRRRTVSARLALERAAERVREHERGVQEAADAERSRIARELHDIVSHSISVVTIQTQAVRRRLGPQHEQEAQDLAMVEITAREALAEMRRLLGVLRTDGQRASLAPQPGLAELRRLADSVGSGGPCVRVQERGDPTPIPPGLALTAYRIAQEGLTNALRHAGASEIVITISYSHDALGVEVRDDGRGLSGRNGSSGHGLLGIRERVGLYRGSVDLHDVPSGGTRLVARLPLCPDAVRPK